MPPLRSVVVATALALAGWVNEGHPVPDSNLSAEENSRWPQPAQR
jgi:hypothetical protein